MRLDGTIYPQCGLENFKREMPFAEDRGMSDDKDPTTGTIKAARGRIFVD